MMIEGGAQQHAPTSPRQIADELVLGIVQLEKSGLLVQSVSLHQKDHTDPETQMLSGKSATKSEPSKAVALMLLFPRSIDGTVEEVNFRIPQRRFAHNIKNLLSMRRKQHNSKAHDEKASGEESDGEEAEGSVRLRSGGEKVMEGWRFEMEERKGGCSFESV